MTGKFRINGREYSIEFDPRDTLLTVLRENGFTEVKEGCSEGTCGACAVLLDGKVVNSCMVFAATAIGKEIITSRGLGDQNNPHPIQEAFAEVGAVQCGFCTPGFVISTFYLLQRNPDPTEDEIKKALDGNLCRCTGYVKIIEGVKLAAERMKNEKV